MEYSPAQMYELVLLALCVWREARGEQRAAKMGVAWVIKNRVNKPGWWGTDWVSVILAPYQFSSFNHNDPNASMLPNPLRKGDWTAWQECLEVALNVYSGQSQFDPTLNAYWYHDKSISKPPGWGDKVVESVEIGNLIFYKEN